MSKSAITILLITREGLVRADLSRGKKVSLAGVWHQPRPDVPDLPSLVEAALHLGPRPARKVYVLTTDLWTQTLELPLHKSTGVNAAELAKALNFEAEALSGLSAFEAVVDQVPLGSHEGLRAHWLVQARSADLDLIDDVVRKAGSKLIGVGHPGGLPRPLIPMVDASRSWQRIELWPDAVVALRGHARGPVDIQVFNSDPQMGRWRADVADWERKSETAEYKELLVAAGSDTLAKIEGPAPLRLDTPDDLASWLLAWGEHLTLKRPGVPLVTPAPIPLSSGQRRGIAGLVGLVALGLCCAHYYLWLGRGIQWANGERVRHQEPAGRLAQLEKQLKDVETRANSVKEEAGKFQHCADKLTAQRKRLARLLSSLARHQHDDLLVQKIDNESGEPRIQGMCLQPELADDFASWLARELRSTSTLPDGWDVMTPRKEARNFVADGGPWHFEITCKIPVDPADAKASLKTAGPAPNDTGDAP